MPPKIQHNTLQSIKILMLGKQTSEHPDVNLHYRGNKYLYIETIKNILK